MEGWSTLDEFFFSNSSLTDSSAKEQAKNYIVTGSSVAQLVERSLPIPEVHGSNPVIGKNLFIY